MYVVVDIGCIECGEPSDVVAVFALEADADRFAGTYTDPGHRWGHPGWYGQHSVQVFKLPEVSDAA